MPDQPPTPMLYAEALVTLCGSSILLRLISFQRLMSLAARNRPDVRPAGALCAAHIRRALAAWARRVPWRALCFEQGLAAQFMLHRRGLSATLFYGAMHDGQELKAHVWVKSRDLDVIGCENASDFAILSQISNDSSSSAVQT